MRNYEMNTVLTMHNNHEVFQVEGVTMEVHMAADTNGAATIDPRIKKELMKEKLNCVHSMDENIGNDVSDNAGDNAGDYMGNNAGNNTGQDKKKDKNDHKRETLEERRSKMGCPNRNLNQVEIYTRHIEVSSAFGTVPVWMYYPRKMEGNQPVLLYVHGGGFFGGSPFAVENQCRLIAEKANCVVCNIDYSLPPETPYPIPTEQIYAVLVYMREHAAAYQIAREQMYIAGDSAGGNMAAVVAMMDRDRGTRYLRGQILLYAKFTFSNSLLPGYDREATHYDLVEEEQEFLEALTFIGCDIANEGDAAVYVQGRYDCTHPYISPAFGTKEGLPKTLLIQAEYDGLRPEGEFYAKGLVEAGVPVRMIRYRNVNHAFFDRLGELPQAEAAVLEIASFLQNGVRPQGESY